MPKATRPDDGRLKANRERADFMQRVVYMPWMKRRLCTHGEVDALYASDKPVARLHLPDRKPPRERAPGEERDWSNTALSEWHLLSDSMLLHFLFLGHTSRDQEAGRGPLDYSLETQVVRMLQARAEERERGAGK